MTPSARFVKTMQFELKGPLDRPWRWLGNMEETPWMWPLGIRHTRLFCEACRERTRPMRFYDDLPADFSKLVGIITFQQRTYCTRKSWMHFYVAQCECCGLISWGRGWIQAMPVEKSMYASYQI